jgi:acetyltransferase-like isoleucine patch superfamily enzyme
MSDLNLPEINILGYSGSHLSLIVETLYQLNYSGKIKIIQHDQVRYFDAPFDVPLNLETLHYNSLDIPPSEGLFFCSNKPSNKLFLLNFFYNLWGIKDHQFISVIHPTSVIASTVRYDAGLYIEPLSVISPYTEVGFGVSVNRSCSIGHHNSIGDFSSIYPGANLSGDVVLERGVTVGPGTTVFAGVKIGANSVIGGGSVVTKSIPPNVLAFGNPCRVVKEIESIDILAANQTGIT